MRTTPLGRRLLLGMMVIIGAALSGCATFKPMALGEKTNTLDTGKESVALLTVKLANQYKPAFQPDLYYVTVLSQEGEKGRYAFRVGDAHRQVKDEFNEYLISIGLPPGKYTMVQMNGLSRHFPISGTFILPMTGPFELKPNTMVYLGRIEAVNRERKLDSEMRAGPVIPLIDQAVSGFSGGTFDVTISDNYENDLAMFSQKYPALTGFTIDRAVLPPWAKPSDEAPK
jgi:hypothetical protein